MEPSPNIMRLFAPLVRALYSTWSTVAVVAAFTLLCVAGAMLPQVGAVSDSALDLWKSDHPVVTAVAEPLGLYEAFSSIPFMVLLAALAVNMVACTTRRAILSRKARGGAAVALGGSLVLHVGLLALLAGGAVTAGSSIDGRIVATEGQVIDLSREDQYLDLRRGVWADGALPGYALGVESSRPVSDGGVSTAVESVLAVAEPGAETVSRPLGVNRPVRLEGVVLTHADWGFSPLLTVVSPAGEVLVDAYVALLSVHGGGAGAYEDVVEAPGLPGTVRLRLLPDVRIQDGTAVSVSPEPRNPALEISVLAEDGTVVESGLAFLGSEAEVQGFNFAFGDLRRWTAVRVRADSGRFVVYAGFAIGLFGLLVRYAPAIWAAARSRRSTGNEVSA
ncbi:MAG: cytochrome c biogenesis protein ResB [Actinobacteria bacterium]|nr:cytochrome c biogenesis protein ResB [Actinomycetota bacterium]